MLRHQLLQSLEFLIPLFKFFQTSMLDSHSPFHDGILLTNPSVCCFRLLALVLLLETKVISNRPDQSVIGLKIVWNDMKTVSN